MEKKEIYCFMFLREEMDLDVFFYPILLLKPNMGIDYINNVLDHKNPL